MMKYLIQDVKRQAEEFLDGLYEAADLAAEEDGPQAYAPMLAEDIRGMEELREAGTYQEIAECLEELKFGRLAAVRGKNVDPEKKEQAAAYRNLAKDGIKKMKALYLPGDIDEVFADLDACREPILMLLELAEEFSAKFQEAKEEKNLVDFNDLEHFAWKSSPEAAWIISRDWWRMNSRRSTRRSLWTNTRTATRSRRR